MYEVKEIEEHRRSREINYNFNLSGYWPRQVRDPFLPTVSL
jgi:hypothetical protein